MKSIIESPMLRRAAAIAIFLVATCPVKATNRTVLNTNDSGPNSLRSAIAASADGDSISFALFPHSTIELTSGELVITHNITIAGPGASLLTVAQGDAGTFFRVFDIELASVTLNISGITISNGHLNVPDVPGGPVCSGGAIYSLGTLIMNNCALTGNVAAASGITGLGGAIYSGRALTLTNCTLSGNTAGASLPDTAGYGGAIYSDGTLNMTNCTLTGNSAIGASTANNFATLASGGAIYNSNIYLGPATLTNCTISGNSAAISGGSNFVNGGGITQAAENAPSMRNTIVAGNTVTVSGGGIASAPDVFGVVNSLGHNVIGNTNNSSGWVASDKTNAAAAPLNLAPLQDFGGGTKVLPLLVGSVAIDAGDDSVTGPPLGLTTDQRGFPRPMGAHVDVGAFEFNPAFVVTTLSDSDDGACDSSCTLREAINAANTSPEDSSITFGPGVFTVVQLSSPLPNLSTNISIQGPGPALLTIRRDTGGTYRIFTVSNGTATGPTVSISGLTLANGSTPSGSLPGSGGGGILVDSATLNLSNCTLTSNSASYGGGLFNLHGNVTITNSTFGGNQVTTSGGGIYNYGANGIANLTGTNSSFYGNLVTGSSGGSGVMENYGGTASFTNCTFYNNSAFGAGVIYNNGLAVNASVTLRDCTVSVNTTTNANSADIVNSAAFGGTATLTLSGNIFKTGAQGPNFLNSSGTVISQGYNLSNDAAGGDGSTGPGGLLNATGDIRNTDPLVADLANNGGPTFTVALLSNSPAINHGDPAAPSRDQRYYTRSGVPDIGAFEFSGALAPVSVVSRKTHGSLPFDIALPLTGTPGVECRSGGATNDYQVIATFATSISVGNVNVTSGIGTAVNATNDFGLFTVNLTGVISAQTIVTTLFGVTDGVNTNDVMLPMAVLLGDTTGNGSVNASDVSLTKLKSGQPVDATNFRTDVTVNGSINASDVSLVKSKSGTALP